MSEPKYYVVQVLGGCVKDIADYWCVVRDWVKIRGPGDPKVLVKFPYRHFVYTEPLLYPLPTARQLEQTTRNWSKWYIRTTLSVVKYRTDSYGDAKRYLQELLNNEEKHEAEILRTSPRLATISAKKDFMTNVLGLTSIPKLRESANTKAQKRKATEGGRKAHNKISKVTEPNEIGEEVAGLSEQPFELINEYQSLTHAMPVEETQEASVERTKIHHTSTEDQPTVNALEPNQSFEDMSRNSLSESNIPAQTEQSKSLISLMSTLQEQLKIIYPILMEIKSTNNNLETAMAFLSAKIEQLEAQKKKDKNYIALLEGIIEDLQKSSNV